MYCISRILLSRVGLSYLILYFFRRILVAFHLYILHLPLRPHLYHLLYPRTISSSIHPSNIVLHFTNSSTSTRQRSVNPRIFPLQNKRSHHPPLRCANDKRRDRSRRKRKSNNLICRHSFSINRLYDSIPFRRGSWRSGETIWRCVGRSGRGEGLSWI